MLGQLVRFPCMCIHPVKPNAQAILDFVAATVAFLPRKKFMEHQYTHTYHTPPHMYISYEISFKWINVLILIRTCASIRAFVSLISCSRTCINWNRASRVCIACCSNWSRKCWISDAVDNGALGDLSSLLSCEKKADTCRVENGCANGKKMDIDAIRKKNCSQLTFGDFFGVKFETGIKSRCVGRFNVGSGVTGIGSMDEILKNEHGFWIIDRIDIKLPQLITFILVFGCFFPPFSSLSHIKSMIRRKFYMKLIDTWKQRPDEKWSKQTFSGLHYQNE